MLSFETTAREQEKEENPEEFFAKYILVRAFENEQASPGQEVLRVGLLNPNTAYELASLRAADTGENLFMIRFASYPSRGIEDWVRTAFFFTRSEALAYIYYLRSAARQAQRI